MKLQQMYSKRSKEYTSNLTSFLNGLNGSKFQYNYHYIYDTRDLWTGCLAIRKSGKTIGNIKVGANNCIEKIVFSNEFIGKKKSFADAIYKEVKKYIGTTLEFVNVKNGEAV